MTARDFVKKYFGRPKRVDHGRMYICIVVGLFLWSLSLMIIGPVPNSVIDELSDYVQVILGLGIFVGTSVCLSGIFMGTRFIAPKIDFRLPLKFALWGVPTILGSVGTYVWAIVHDNPSFWTSIYGAALGGFISLGLLWNSADFVSELIRLGDEVEALKEIQRKETTCDDQGECEGDGDAQRD